MACQKIVVRPSALGGWIAKLSDREAGPYVSRDLALRVAVAEATQIRSVDHHVCVVVEDARDEVLAACCTCRTFEQKLASASQLPAGASGASEFE